MPCNAIRRARSISNAQSRCAFPVSAYPPTPCEHPHFFNLQCTYSLPVVQHRQKQHRSAMASQTTRGITHTKYTIDARQGTRWQIPNTATYLQARAQQHTTNAYAKRKKARAIDIRYAAAVRASSVRTATPVAPLNLSFDPHVPPAGHTDRPKTTQAPQRPAIRREVITHRRHDRCM
jgi:hypothetical protein